MTDVLLGIGAGKLVLSGAVAILARLVQKRVGQPRTAHGLWVLVLLVLVVPAVVAVPAPAWLLPAEVGSGAAGGAGATAVGAPGSTPDPWSGLVVLWVLGASAVLGGSLIRSLRFGRRVLASAREAEAPLAELVRELAGTLRLARPPRVVLTEVRLSPLVWWAGGRTHLVLPRELVDRLDPDELRWIIAHELAHVRRRDPLVRWIEWLASVVFWWNPVTWWARHHLRIQEELCCDALVLSALGDPPHARRRYAGTLLTVLEFLSTPPRLTTPAFASGAEARGRISLIERRLHMIVSNGSNRTPSRWLRRALQVTAVLVLPLSFVYCGPDAPVAPEVESELELHQVVEEIPTGQIAEVPVLRLVASEKWDHGLRRAQIAERLEAAVASGELTPEEAKARYGGTLDLKGTSYLIPLDRTGTIRQEAPDETGGIEVEWVASMRDIERALARDEIVSEEARAKFERLKVRLDRGN